MLQGYVEYLNGLKNGLHVSVGNTGELMQAYRITALLILNYAVLIAVGVLAAIAVFKIISVVTFHVIRFSYRHDKKCSKDLSIVDGVASKAIKVFVVAASIILVSSWFTVPTQLFLFSNMDVSTASMISVSYTIVLLSFTAFTVYNNWIVIASGESVRPFVNHVANRIFSLGADKKGVLVENALYDSMRKYNMDYRGVSEYTKWITNENLDRAAFEKRLLNEFLSMPRIKHEYDFILPKSKVRALNKLYNI